ncbi:MAG: hypothetical protein Q8Q94_02635 [bacterium]|nr:hypothetical protein [bacterium]
MPVGDVLANGFGIQLDKPAGEYIANVDYDATGGIFLGTPVQFAFQLFTKDRSTALAVDDVWVTITSTGTNANYMPPVLDVGIVGSDSAIVPPGMTFAFPYGGLYNMKVRFDKDGKTLAEATFPLTVGGAEEKTADAAQNRIINLFLLGAVVVVMVIVIISFFRGERKKA